MVLAFFARKISLNAHVASIGHMTDTAHTGLIIRIHNRALHTTVNRLSAFSCRWTLINYDDVRLNLGPPLEPISEMPKPLSIPPNSPS
jgi:hypothetical protein